jgi:hypothetical protein
MDNEKVLREMMKAAWVDIYGNWTKATEKMDNEKVLKAMRKAGWPYTMSSLDLVEDVARAIECYNAPEEVPKPMPHLALRKLWLAQREAGTHEQWQVRTGGSVDWKDILASIDPLWNSNNEYRVKPKTAKYYFALCKWRLNNSVDAVSDTSREEINRKAATYGYEIVGEIVEREIEL